MVSIDYRKLHDNLGKPLERLPNEIRAGTNAVLVNGDGEVLIHRRSDNGRWALPGGVQEIGESAAECAVREMAEETGIETRAKRLVGVYSDPANHCIMRYPNGHLTHYVISLFEVEYVSGSIQVSDESYEVAYFHPDRFPDTLMPASQLRIKDALARRPEAYFR